jgi:hypothetical protein
MNDSLVTAAERFGVPTEESAGPESMPGAQLWARWPRHRLEVAHDVLSRIMSLHDDVVVARNGSASEWRAWSGDWFYEGRFDEAVGALGLYLTNGEGAASRERHSLMANVRLGH